MGIMFTCQKVECEEEILQRILSTMQLTYIESKLAYYEFLKCIDKNGSINFFQFQKYLGMILGNSIYKIAQKEFFDNLYRSTGKNIKVIGAIIIFLSKGGKTDKIELLKIHFTNYYQGLNDTAIKAFVEDIIDANTDNCIISFKNNLSVDLIKNMCEVYQIKHKRKLEGLILRNYDGIKSKYFQLKNSNETNLCDTDNDNINNNIILMNGNELDRLNNSFADCNEDVTREKYMKMANERPISDLLNNNPDDKSLKAEKVLKEFFELSFPQLSGEFIRNWLYDEYIKDKPYDNSCL